MKLETEKKFDCVAKKAEWQKKAADETAGLSPSEVNTLIAKKISTDPILGSWWKDLQAKAAKRKAS